MEEAEPASAFADRLRAYLEELWGEPVRIGSLRQVSQGESRYTWLVDATVDGGRTPHRLVLSIDRDAGLIDSRREVEAEVLRIVHADGSVPVPELIAAEYAENAVGHPFVLTTRVEGAADPVALLSADYDDCRPVLARQLIEILGAIGSIDPTQAGLTEVLPAPTVETAAAEALDHWEGVFRQHDVGPLPATEAAIRRLRRDLPAAERIGVVHGDYRIGNFLHDRARVTAILDWELTHLGDPLEDLGWILSENWWSERFPGKACGLFDEAQLIEGWEAATGLRCGRQALAWWRLLAEVKANALWVTGASHFIRGRTRDLNLPFVAWTMIPKAEVLIGEMLGVTAR